MLTFEQMKCGLCRKGISAASIGNKLGISRRAVSMTMLRIIKKDRNRAAIAEALGMEYDAVWGDK